PTRRAASAQPAVTPSASRPRMAAMPTVPTGTASCMACARKRTRGKASLSVSTPAATKAEYSPSEWPATTAGCAPPSASQARQQAMAAVSITGSVLVVRSRVSFGPSAIRRPMSSPSASEASASVSRTAAWPCQASSMPTACEPCPGNTNANAVMGEIYPFCSVIQQHRAPGEAAAHTFEQQGLPPLDAAVANGLVQRQGDRRGGGVAVLVDRGDHALERQLELLGRALHDAQIRLMGNQPVDAGGVAAGRGQHL